MTEERALVVADKRHLAAVPDNWLPSVQELGVLIQVIGYITKGRKIQIQEGDAMNLALTARGMGMDLMEAINGGLHIIEGKIEMAARMMAKRIVLAGHKYEIIELDEEKAVIKGTRGDDGREYTASYTVEQARKAGLVKERGNWDKHPEDMVFARAISRLGRRLFPEVTGMAYVEGEIREIFGEPTPEPTPAVEITNATVEDLSKTIAESAEKNLAEKPAEKKEDKKTTKKTAKKEKAPEKTTENAAAEHAETMAAAVQEQPPLPWDGEEVAPVTDEEIFRQKIAEAIGGSDTDPELVFAQVAVAANVRQKTPEFVMGDILKNGTFDKFFAWAITQISKS